MTDHTTHWIINEAGERVTYKPEKVTTSLLRSGADDALAKSITAQVSAQLDDGMRTSDIYCIAYDLLKQEKRPIAARYSLKKAIMALGPTGFPFERFVGEVMRRRGYQVGVGQRVEGSCVTHEVDVVATTDTEHITMECKYHNEQRIRTGVKVPLYIYARFLDITDKISRVGVDTHDVHAQWIVTNTKFSGDAARYGKCKGMTLIGWRYPSSGGLEALIEDAGLHPVTALPGLSRAQQQKLLKQEIVLCADVVTNPRVLDELGLSKEAKEQVLADAESLVSMQSTAVQ